MKNIGKKVGLLPAFAVACVMALPSVVHAAEAFGIAKGEVPEIVVQAGLRPFVAKAAEEMTAED